MPPDATAVAMADDVQPKTGPALSATSDMPEVAPAPPPVSEEVKPADTAEKPDQATEDKPADAEEKPADAEKPAEGEEKPEGEIEALASDKTPAWMKALASKERNKARVAEARAVAAEKLANDATTNLTKALGSIETLTKAQAAQISEAAEKEDPRPAREAFEDPTKYETALVDWAGRRSALVAAADERKKIEGEQAALKDTENKKALKEQNDRVLSEFADRKAKFVETHPDYDDLVEQSHPDDPSKELQISIPMAQVILNEEDGPDIAYYLGKNPDEAERISKLAPVKAIAEMGKISARLAAKPTPVTKPAPLKVLKTGSETAVRKSPNEESMEEYGARRQREIANKDRTRRGLAPLN